MTWTLTERVEAQRVILAVYTDKRAEVTALGRQFGGRVSAVKQSEWLKPQRAAPTKIGRRLEVIHEEASRKKKTAIPRLIIPMGLAFGSGEHATTFMLLRALAARRDLAGASVLDVGTGSGVLALAARLFGAKKIVATDFDADAVRTARQNEALNFSQTLIDWHEADVKKLRSGPRFDFVLANLFSGILQQAAPQIVRSVKPGGELWLSGVLKTQCAEVMRFYRGQRMRSIGTTARGKWVMLRFSKPVA